MQQTDTEGEQAWLNGERDSLGIVQETEVWSYRKIVYTQTRIYPRKWDTQIDINYNWSAWKNPEYLKRDWVRKAIHWKLCLRLKFDHTDE